MSACSVLENLEGHPARAEQMSFEQLLDSGQELLPAPASQPPAPKPAAPVSGRHQDLQLYVTVLLKTFVEMTDAGLVRDMPFEVWLDGGKACYPDIAFVSSQHLDRVHEAYIEGPPDIIIEIVSLESTALDRGEKFVDYEMNGVREYWLIDPARELVDLYHLGPDGYYDEFRPDIAGRLRSRVLKGFTLDIDRLWKRVLPTTSEIVGMVSEMVAQR